MTLGRYLFWFSVGGAIGAVVMVAAFYFTAWLERRRRK